MERKVSEWTVILLVTAVQVINVLEFMMVVPLGPDFTRALGIDGTKIGLISGSYAAAAFASGVVGSFFLDLFDRRKALVVTMVGLVMGTAAGGLSIGLHSMMAARLLAGMFGGPATSVALSIVADVVPNERRGKALGVVMGAFSVANVLGLPAALKASEWRGWRVPFFSVAAMGVGVVLFVAVMLPSLTGHLETARKRRGHQWAAVRTLLGRREIRTSYTMTATVNMAGFILLPVIPAYVLGNLHYPRPQLGNLYLAGGLASLVVLQVVGRLVDRFGSFRVGTFGAALLAVVLYFGFIDYQPELPVMVLFVSFMVSMGFRNVSYSTLTSKVPNPAERAQFMSLQSSVQHVASALAAGASSLLLSEGPDHEVIGIGTAAAISMGLNLLLPPLLWAVEGFVQQRALSARAAAPVELAPAAAPAPAVASQR